MNANRARHGAVTRFNRAVLGVGDEQQHRVGHHERQCDERDLPVVAQQRVDPNGAATTLNRAISANCSARIDRPDEAERDRELHQERPARRLGLPDARASGARQKNR